MLSTTLKGIASVLHLRIPWSQSFFFSCVLITALYLIVGVDVNYFFISVMNFHELS